MYIGNVLAMLSWSAISIFFLMKDGEKTQAPIVVVQNDMVLVGKVFMVELQGCILIKQWT